MFFRVLRDALGIINLCFRSLDVSPLLDGGERVRSSALLGTNSFFSHQTDPSISAAGPELIKPPQDRQDGVQVCYGCTISQDETS